MEELYGEVGYLDVPYQVLAKDPAFLASTIHMEIPDGFAGFLFNNGKLVSFANRKEYTFWNVFEKHEIKIVSMEEPVVGPEVTKRMLSIIPGNLYTTVSVGEGETGLVYYDNVLQKQLSKGIYRFWNYTHNISYRVVDLSLIHI